jgi:hypothetical protein
MCFDVAQAVEKFQAQQTLQATSAGNASQNA